MNGIEERLAAIEARFALSELRSKYGWYTARADREAVVALFTEDGVFENYRTESGEPAVAAGRAALAAYFRRMAPGRRLPTVTNEVVQIDGDRAEGTCVMVSIGSDAFCGHYVDRFRRVEGIWLFERRSFFPYWPVFAPSPDRKDP